MARTKNIGRQITPQSSPSSTPSPQSSSPPPPPTPMQNASETNFDTFKTANNSEAVSPTQNKIMSNQTPSKNTSEEQLAEAIVRLSQIVPTEETTPHKKSPTRPKEIPTSSKSPFHFQYSRKPLITSPVRRSARISLGIGTVPIKTRNAKKSFLAHSEEYLSDKEKVKLSSEEEAAGKEDDSAKEKVNKGKGKVAEKSNLVKPLVPYSNRVSILIGLRKLYLVLESMILKT
ncbi:hypothetical protein TSUD_107040 [Trifolium subterraneum]|uniref:Uncharacterized protein n=1 Tax=Trifolium subterraneum TaxID=3900 RepID=A0A2Z6MH17_TRISU|nr:hypothetical protein TSUD_107040 [Trifolium subterraneum]